MWLDCIKRTTFLQYIERNQSVFVHMDKYYHWLFKAYFDHGRAPAAASHVRGQVPG